MQRYLVELERLGYTSIVKGSRYKGFEYNINSWHDMEMLKSRSNQLVTDILKQIKEVTRIPPVAQTPDGLHKPQKTSKKKPVAQPTTESQDHE